MLSWFRPKPSTAGRTLARIGARKRQAASRQRYIELHDEMRRMLGKPPFDWRLL